MAEETKTPEQQATQTPNPAPPAAKTETPAPPAKAEAAPAKPKQGSETETKVDPAAPVVPEKYVLKLPEQSPLSTARLEKIEAYCKAQGFSQEQAQALVENEHAAVATFAEEQNRSVETLKEGWKNELVSDKELGGEALAKNAEHAKRVIDVFADDTLKDELDRTGLGNHPGFFRMCVKIGKLIGEDGMVRGGAPAMASKKTAEELLYGGTNP